MAVVVVVPLYLTTPSAKSASDAFAAALEASKDAVVWPGVPEPLVVKLKKVTIYNLWKM